MKYLFTIENYRNSLIKGLEAKSSDLIERLKATTHLNYYKEIDLLDFTVLFSHLNCQSLCFQWMEKRMKSFMKELKKEFFW